MSTNARFPIIQPSRFWAVTLLLAFSVATRGQTQQSTPTPSPTDTPSPQATTIERWVSINSSGVIAAIGNGGHALLLLPVQINAYRPQMVPNSIDISSSDPTQNIISQSEVSKTGVHIRVNGDNENTNLVEVTYSCPVLAKMTNLSAAVQVSSTSDLQVWTTNQKGAAIIGSNNQGNLTLDGNGNATIWVEALTSGTHTLNFLIVSGTKTIGNSGSLNFVNYDSFTEAFSGETKFGGSAQTQGIFGVAQKLYHEGYNIAYYDVNAVNNSNGNPAYAELSNQIQHGFVKSVGVFGCSHGGGQTYIICSLLCGLSGSVQIVFTGYVDAIQHSGPFNGTYNFFAETRYPPGSAFHWNYYQTSDQLHGNAVSGAAVNLNVTSTAWGANLLHYTHNGKTGIDDSSTVLQASTSAVESNVPKY